MRCSFWHDEAEELAATWNESDALSSFDQQDQQAQGRKIVGKRQLARNLPCGMYCRDGNGDALWLCDT